MREIWNLIKSITLIEWMILMTVVLMIAAGLIPMWVDKKKTACGSECYNQGRIYKSYLYNKHTEELTCICGEKKMKVVVE